MATTKTANPNIGQTIRVPLTAVKADFEWNLRKVVGDKEASLDGETEVNEYKQLKASIDKQGQITPCVVRPRGKDGYELASGFRRYQVLTELAKENGTKNPEVLVSVLDLDDFEMRVENLRENSARKKVDPTETLRGLIHLRELNPKISVVDIADKTGIGRSYASNLLSINERLKPELMKRWMDSKTEIGVNKIQKIAKVDKDRQEEEWDNEIKTAGRGTGGGGGSKAWLTKASKDAEKYGVYLGRLQGFGCIDAEDLDFDEHLDKVITVAENMTKEEKKMLVGNLAASFQKGVKEAKEPPEPKEEKKSKKKGEEEAAAN